ncbi:MAG: methylmalonyl Co-A mutase-associated GTPase MeaB [Desulfobacterales bacterium]|nr:methylmalonyl Co-A mutase-associated GTPase MeaB [Desulfobacterales bacterium]MDD4073782.1 methylmalonyl Co-A mutase-associated GTPase MeaB [Desulfobacterales bacterium]MDD4393877.1 methylmalonyl Co-A mutase-associated GTPase MeaB [Desulfobacterales bacterium]
MNMDYAAEIIKGSSQAVSRMISWLENEDDRARPCMEKLYKHTGNAYIIGITGAPGAGKSTLTDKLTRHLRRQGLTVGIIAVDPTSPFTGGAILGDRVRMSEIALDPGVFIRSMATRGYLGGLAQATGNAVKVLDASGKDIVLIETVGVGQDEVDIIRIADTVCLVLVPGLGDVIQSMKAGVMEIADVYAINKADRQGADQLFAEVSNRVAQDAQIRERLWEPPVLQTISTEDEGIVALAEALKCHQDHLKNTGRLLNKRRERIHQETLQMINYELFRRVEMHLAANGRLDTMVNAIMNHEENPYTIIRQVLDECVRLPRKPEK